MANDYLLVASNAGVSLTTNATMFGPLSGGSLVGGSETAEAPTQAIARATYTLKNLYVSVTANSRTGADTVKSRKNGADGAMAISITASTTGAFEDTTNSDSLVSGDLFCHSWAHPSTQSLTFRQVGAIINSSGTVPWISYAHTGGASNFGTTNYTCVSGNGLIAASPLAESVTNYVVRAATTISNLYVTASANTCNGATTITTRKNGADGNGSVSFAASTSGSAEDITHTDTYAINDTMNLKIVSGGTSGFATLNMFEVTATSNASALLTDNYAQSVSATKINSATTKFYNFSAAMGPSSTESDTQHKMRVNGIFQYLYFESDANTLDGAATLTLRQNAADSSLTLSVGASTTGTFSDVTDVVTVVGTDLLNHKVVSAGTTGSLTLRTMALDQLQVRLLVGTIAMMGAGK